MRLVQLLAFGSTAAVCLLVAGCSGATETEFFEPRTDDNRASPSPSSAPPPAAPTPPPPSPSGTGATEPTEPGRTDPTKGGDKCLPEAEPNDALEKATVFTQTLCGTLSPADPIDWVAFVAPADAKAIRVSHKESGGKVGYRVYINGALAALQSIDAIGRVEPGATYHLQARLTGNAPAAYELKVDFTP